MRTQQRSFVVEIKSTRRRLKTQPKSIWGNTDFGALIRDTEATLPFMQDAIAEAPITRGNLPLEPKQQIEIADLSASVDEQPGVMPLTASDQIEQHQQEAASSDSEVSKAAVARPERQTVRTAERRRIGRASLAADTGKMPPVMAAKDVIEVQDDELALLDAENLQLKRLLAEYLEQENAQLRQMLKRFD